MPDLDLSHVFTTFPVLETERCLLREITDDDTADVLRLMGDPLVNRYLGRFPLASMEEAQKRVQVFRTNYQEQIGVVWGIAMRGQPDSLIGNCLVWNLDKRHARAELGYALTPEWWGKGL
ncbi:MAG TPA: GNAT family N-acetyltransferase, partial [Phototrophicaceae bacterium]|nr:GNAT family N-acetyltransferase [Phototrophicaceae bacterium]